MTSWANQFDELKNQFVARSKERLMAIESLLGRLQAAPSDVALLKQTMQHFHWLAGSGGTYGFDDITSWGTYGEELCDYLLKLQTPVSDADLDKLGTAFRTVEQLFAAYTPTTVARTQDDIVQNKMRNTMELLTPPSQGLANAIQEAANAQTNTGEYRTRGGTYNAQASEPDYDAPASTPNYNAPASTPDYNAPASTPSTSNTGSIPRPGILKSLFSTTSLSPVSNQQKPGQHQAYNPAQTDGNPRGSGLGAGSGGGFSADHYGRGTGSAASQEDSGRNVIPAAGNSYPAGAGGGYAPGTAAENPADSSATGFPGAGGYQPGSSGGYSGLTGGYQSGNTSGGFPGSAGGYQSGSTSDGSPPGSGAYSSGGTSSTGFPPGGTSGGYNTGEYTIGNPGGAIPPGGSNKTGEFERGPGSTGVPSGELGRNNGVPSGELGRGNYARPGAAAGGGPPGTGYSGGPPSGSYSSGGPPSGAYSAGGQASGGFPAGVPQGGATSGAPPSGTFPGGGAYSTAPVSNDSGIYPGTSYPAQTGETPRPGAGAPPLSSMGIDPIATRILGTASSGPAPTMEPRRSTRLSHIPTDKKFAVFADSNFNNLTPIKAALEERGLLIEGVATASEAKALFAERLPDVFIVGAPLTDSDGYELVEFLRGLEAGHKPIVVVLAQQAVFLDKVHAIRSGADAFFEYPSELTDLIDKLNNLLDRDKNENYKVLSVEDDPDMANFIKLTLQSAGYTVLHISDPKTFEENFLSFEPDLVMLDIVLGDMTGFELAKYIRQNDRFAPIPIVFLTTQNKLHQHIRSAIAGGDEHLIKPVAPQLLIATVASRLERARSLKRLIDRDGLTRCLHFGSFMERAQKLTLSDGYRSAPAMMMIDVDNMKKFNENLGFAAGDRIISNIANMLLKGFRNTDLIARFGNDQFAIVLEHLNPQQLQSLSSQVLGAISGTPQLVKARSVSVTCSGGVAILEQGMTVQEWLDAAQDALRTAKDAGGNRPVVRPLSRS